MQDQEKTKDQLIDELNKMRRKVAELEQVVNDLKRKTEEQALLLNTIDTQIWYLTDLETYGLVNQSRADFLGKRRDEIEGKKLYDFCSHYVAAVCKASNAEVFQSRQTVYTEELIPNAAGEPRLISITKIPKLDEHGNVEYVVCAGTDITERKRAEDVLHENEQRLKLALEGGSLGMWDWDFKTGRAVWDEGVIRMLGYEPGELDSHVRTWKRLIHSDDWGEVSEVLNEHLSGRLPSFGAEYRMRTKSGDYKWFYSRNKVVEHAKDGKPQRITGTILDVTERKRVEKALRESEERFRSLVEHLPQRIFIKDRNSVYISCNGIYASDLGISPEEIVGKNDFEFYPPKRAQMYRADDQDCMDTGMITVTEKPYQLDGQDRWAHTIKVPYRDRQGRIIGVRNHSVSRG